MKLYLFVLAGLFLLTGCASTPLQELVRDVMADGQVSSAEAQMLRDALPPAFDWGAAGRSALEIALAIAGVKILPGSLLRGPWDKPPQQPSA